MVKGKKEPRNLEIQFWARVKEFYHFYKRMSVAAPQLQAFF
jgi:hypothetical protein